MVSLPVIPIPTVRLPVIPIHTVSLTVIPIPTASLRRIPMEIPILMDSLTPTAILTACPTPI